MQKSTGKKWEVERPDLGAFIKDAEARLAKHDYSAIGPLIVGSIVNKDLDNDYASKKELSNKLFGIEEESVQSLVDGLVKA